MTFSYPWSSKTEGSFGTQLRGTISLELSMRYVRLSVLVSGWIDLIPKVEGLISDHWR